MRFEASDEIAHFVASQELFYNEIKQPADILKRIEAVGKKGYFKNCPRIISAGKSSVCRLWEDTMAAKKQTSFIKNIG